MSGSDPSASDRSPSDRSPTDRRPSDQSAATRPAADRRIGTAERARTAVETAVPPGAPVHRCARCDRPFADASSLALHRGLAHGADLSAAERDAYAEALDAERADLRRFRIVALGALVLLYFGLLFAYAVFA